jgi:hypothetical protein
MFENSGEPINRTDISDFEKKYTISFSRDYVELLIKHNGGIPNKCLYEGETDSLILNELFSLNTGVSSVERKIIKFKIQEKILPDFLIPIGSDPANNLICLSQSYESFGHVYLWLFDSLHNIRFIASSLKIVIENLQEFNW